MSFVVIYNIILVRHDYTIIKKSSKHLILSIIPDKKKKMYQNVGERTGFLSKQASCSLQERGNRGCYGSVNIYFFKLQFDIGLTLGEKSYRIYSKTGKMCRQNSCMLFKKNLKLRLRSTQKMSEKRNW